MNTAWTKETPVEPGWYWVRSSNQKPMVISHLINPELSAEREIHLMNYYGNRNFGYEGIEFSQRIPEPEAESN